MQYFTTLIPNTANSSCHLLCCWNHQNYMTAAPSPLCTPEQMCALLSKEGLSMGEVFQNTKHNLNQHTAAAPQMCPLVVTHTHSLFNVPCTPSRNSCYWFPTIAPGHIEWRITSVEHLFMRISVVFHWMQTLFYRCRSTLELPVRCLDVMMHL